MKAANLLISNQGILQIADFGLARVLHDEPAPDSTEPRREYTNMVVTRWYRPPELLLGERRYTTAIDLWGVGCILAEMYRGKPILQGKSDLEQLNMIFTLCGTPTEATMPGWTLLPGCENIRSFASYPRLLEREYKTYDKEMVDLLAGLLRLDPVKRLSASEALQHAYFTTDPLPANPEDLPNYEASHELDKRKHDADRRALQPVPKPPEAAGQMAGASAPDNRAAARDSVPPQTSAWPRPSENGSRGREADRPREYSRYDDRGPRDDPHKPAAYSREHDSTRYRSDPDRDRHPAVDTYIPSYSKARHSPDRYRRRSRERYGDSRDRYGGRDHYRDHSRDRDRDRAPRRSRSRSRSDARSAAGDRR